MSTKSPLDDLVGESDSATNRPHPFPPIVDAADLLATEMPPPPELIAGLFRKGEKAMLGGQSKSMKSWASLDVGISISHGVPFIDREVTEGRVLFVNLELPQWSLRKRILDVSREKGIKSLESNRLLTLTLRGHRTSANELRLELQRIGDKDLALVVVDPFYKLAAGLDENAAGAMTEVLGTLEGITADTGAALLIPAHFAKGSAAQKESIDRISGSGVFARDPDSILTLTALEARDTFALESTLRTLPPIAPIGLRWAFPLFRIDATLDTANLRQARKGGRKVEYPLPSLAALVPASGITRPEWRKRADEKMGIGKTRFYELSREAEASGLVVANAADLIMPAPPKETRGASKD